MALDDEIGREADRATGRDGADGDGQTACVPCRVVRPSSTSSSCATARPRCSIICLPLVVNRNDLETCPARTTWVGGPNPRPTRGPGSSPRPWRSTATGVWPLRRTWRSPRQRTSRQPRSATTFPSPAISRGPCSRAARGAPSPDSAIFDGVQGLRARVTRLAEELAAFYERSESWWRAYEREPELISAWGGGVDQYYADIEQLMRAALGDLSDDDRRWRSSPR